MVIGLQHKSGLTCLQRNHTEAVAHVVALSALTTWAAEQLGQQIPIRPELRALVDSAVFRLDVLHEPRNKNDTYRAGVLAKRIDPVCPDIALVREKASLGFGVEGG